MLGKKILHKRGKPLAEIHHTIHWETANCSTRILDCWLSLQSSHIFSCIKPFWALAPLWPCPGVYNVQCYIQCRHQATAQCQGSIRWQECRLATRGTPRSPANTSHCSAIVYPIFSLKYRNCDWWKLAKIDTVLSILAIYKSINQPRDKRDIYMVGWKNGIMLWYSIESSVEINKIFFIFFDVTGTLKNILSHHLPFQCSWL